MSNLALRLVEDLPQLEDTQLELVCPRCSEYMCDLDSHRLICMSCRLILDKSCHTTE